MKKKEKPPKEKAKPSKKRSTFSGGCLILVWGIASITFALIIHWLFSTPAPYDWMVAKWSAGDMLTYASTVALGLLAVWQNQKFKEENDAAQKLMDEQNTAAQERLERISIEANELNVIAQISEHEAKYLDILTAAYDEFFDACSIECLTIILADGSLDTITRALQRIHTADRSLLETALAGYQLHDLSIMPLLDKCRTYSQQTSLILSNQLKEENINMNMLYEMSHVYLDIFSEKNAYIATRRRALYRLLFEKLTLAEVRALYIEPDIKTGEKQ